MPKRLTKPSIDLIKKYNYATSYYSDYPPLGLWDKKLGDSEYRKAFEELADSQYNEPSLLYIHYPYCHKQCFYCLCFSLISKKHDKAKEFLVKNQKDMQMVRDLCESHSFNLNIKRIHLGGGSPSCLNLEEFDRLEKQLNLLVDTKKVEEFSIEIDPRTVTPEMMRYYHDRGINRISFGIQDFDQDVQKAVNRIQPIELIERLMTPKIRGYFKGVNFDVIYGLPKQTRASFKKTMKEVVRLSPDRLGVCILGWRPDIFRHQRLIRETELPSIEEGAFMNFDAIQTLLDHGYERIGIDFYAKPTDDLALGLHENKLRRSAMGYSRGDIMDVIGFGPSAMSRMDNYCFQRKYDISEHNADLANNSFPVLRGWKLNKDEQIRREIMEKIICYSYLNFDSIEQKYDIDFKSYFKKDLRSLKNLIKDKIVETDMKSFVKVTDIGRFFHRHVCVAFDELLRQGEKYQHARDTA